MARLLNIAKAIGSRHTGSGLGRSIAQIDLDVAGTWVGFAPPVPSGTVQLHSVTAELQGVAEPLLISSASATLANQEVTVTSFAAGIRQRTGDQWIGQFPGTLHRSRELHLALRRSRG